MAKAVRDPLLPITHYQRLNKQQSKQKSALTLWVPIIFLLIVVLTGVFLLQREIEALNKEANATPLPTIAEEQEPIMTPAQASPSATKEGQFCGGIGAIQCGEGFTCQLDGTYPDAGGKCISADKNAPTVKKPTRPDLPVSSAPVVSQEPVDGGVMCTQEAMQCPDGSWVGRSGPKCEFKCPGQ